MTKKLLPITLLAVLFSASAMAASGKILDLYGPISKSFDQQLSQYAMQDPVMEKYPPQHMPMEEAAGVFSRALDKMGYNYDATTYKALNEASKEQLNELQDSGAISIIAPVMESVRTGKRDILIQQGIISKQTADVVQAALDTMHGKKTQQPQKQTPPPAGAKHSKSVSRAAQKEPAQVCGEITYAQPIGTKAEQITIKDMNGKLWRYYFGDSNADSCHNIAKKGNFICFEVEKEMENTPSLESLGANDPVIRWIGNCVTPG